MVNDDLLRLASYVRISSYRLRVVNALDDKDVMIPTVIAKECGILPNHISKCLRELSDKGVIECINPDVRKGRLYRLTDLGREVMGVVSSLL